MQVLVWIPFLLFTTPCCVLPVTAGTFPARRTGLPGTGGTICNAIDRNGGTPYERSGARSKNFGKRAPSLAPSGRIEIRKRRFAMKIGLALGSGSARGWSHIGIIEALAELDIHPEIVCGTSIGSIVGAAYATGNLDKLKQRVCALTKLNTASYFNFSMSIDGFVNKEKLNAFFADCVIPPGMLIENLPVRYASVATEVTTGREYWLKKGPLEEAIWSSISLPGLFPPVFYHDRWLFDGGLVNPVPISVCRALGADIVLAVNLNGELIGRHSVKKKPKETKEGEGAFVERIAMTIRQYGTTLFRENEPPAHQPPSIFGTIASAVDIVQDRITRSRMAGDPPDIFLTPRLSHVGLLEFYKAEEIINEGKACVSRALPALETLLHRDFGHAHQDD